MFTKPQTLYAHLGYYPTNNLTNKKPRLNHPFPPNKPPKPTVYKNQ